MAFNFSWKKLVLASTATAAAASGVYTLSYQNEAQARLPPTRALRYPPR